MKFAPFSLMQWPEDRSAAQVYASEIEQLVAAEAQGYDAVWVAEHHFSRYGIAPSIHLTAAHLAARTRRLRIGTAVTVLPFFHPLRAAEEIAMLDQLSGGRIDWGVGRGYQGHEFAGFGVDISQSHLIFREQIEIVKRSWTEGRFSHHGSFYRFDDVLVLPPPVQRPHPPIWIAAISPSTLEWAADAGYPVLTDQFSPTSRIADSRAVYDTRARRAGVPVDTIDLPVLRQVYVGSTHARAREEARPALLWYYRALANVGSPGGPGGAIPENYSFYRLFGEGQFNPDADPDAFCKFLFEECTIIGDAAYCRDKLIELRERIRLNYLIAWQNFGGLPVAATAASQRRFIEEVAPAVA
jgi:alkanesulfonate monooxygenase SsuD/methylene tetrahydromethanopterin reductase-like flavin-dependent oxidoreductase (luciferase family)